ncbi:MAG: isoprenylcysteine carboxylmethyltransferase family protein [Candidatus Dormibacterales bacterium]
MLWLIAPSRFPGLAGAFAYAPVLPCLAIVAVIAAAEWLWPKLRPPSATALARTPLRPLDLRRVGVRLYGFAVTLALVAFAYWLFPEYGGSFYEPYWRFLRTIAPVAALVPLYMLWADRRSSETRDEYYEFGALAAGRWRSVDRATIRRHLLGWTVKAYFLPLMTVYLGDEIGALYRAAEEFSTGTVSPYPVFFHLSYAVDLLYCVIGYTTTIRLFDTHIRSVEPTVAGWLVALVCYQPFYSVIGRFYLQYEDNTAWDNWLQPWPALQGAWGATIIVLALTYALATVAFGLRFSNLTHRGIITSGPYRLTKHPAYLAKNLSWWLISVPFISEQGASAALRHCCLLVLLNLVYYARARTEERHLSRDPAYVAYALWMNEHGLLRVLGRLSPVFHYRAPEGKA